MGSKQLGFGGYGQSTAKKLTKRERLLSEMEAIVPWKELLDPIEPHYPKISSEDAPIDHRGWLCSGLAQLQSDMMPKERKTTRTICRSLQDPFHMQC